MSRLTESEYGENPATYLWQANVRRGARGKRGQAFLKELRDILIAMPEKRLVESDWITPQGEVCVLGAYLRAKDPTVVAIAENKAAIAQTKTAIDDNTAITKELGTEMNGRMTELVAVNRSQAKQEGVVQEQAAQAARDIASH
jgi:hypothetical protein